MLKTEAFIRESGSRVSESILGVPLIDDLYLFNVR